VGTYTPITWEAEGKGSLELRDLRTAEERQQDLVLIIISAKSICHSKVIHEDFFLGGQHSSFHMVLI
jgi:hypothetical protein